MEKILVATDFSANSKKALQYADAMANYLKGELILLNVYVPPVGNYSMISGMVTQEISRVRYITNEQLIELKSKYVITKCSTRVECGIPAEEIIEVSKKVDADYIFIGTHGLTRVQRFVLGSTTNDVISKSSIPVFAVPKNYSHKKIKNIVYASDLINPINELKLLIPLARKLKAKIEMFNLNYGWNGHELETEDVRNNISRLSFKNIKLIRRDASLRKSIAQQIHMHLRKVKPDLLVMFPESKKVIDRLLFGSSTKQLAYRLNIPLLSIRRESVKINKNIIV